MRPVSSASRARTRSSTLRALTCLMLFAILLPACGRIQRPCVPADRVRVQLGSVVYAIPSELQPDLEVTNDKKALIRPSPAAASANGAAGIVYCQKPTDTAWPVITITFNQIPLKLYTAAVKELRPLGSVQFLFVTEYTNVSRTSFPFSRIDDSGRYDQYNTPDFTDYVSIDRPFLNSSVFVSCSISFPDRMPCRAYSNVPGVGDVTFDIERKVFLAHREAPAYAAAGLFLSKLVELRNRP